MKNKECDIKKRIILRISNDGGVLTQITKLV